MIKERKNDSPSRLTKYKASRISGAPYFNSGAVFIGSFFLQQFFDGFVQKLHIFG
jgi:hypothetical protein